MKKGSIVLTFFLFFSLLFVQGYSCTANFSYGNLGNQYWFSNSSTGTYSSQLWQFSNGDTTSSNFPNVAFQNTGPHWACLSLFDAGGNLCDTMCVYFNVNCVASASYNVFGLTANFTYTGSPADSIHWQFGDGNTSTQQNPSHTYASAGPYGIILSIFDSTGTLCDTASFSIVVGFGPYCSNPPTFTYTQIGNYFSFTNTTPGAYGSQVWHFSDGDSSSQKNPKKSFMSPGPQWACLYIYDSLGSFCDSACQYFDVNCMANMTYVVSGFTVYFTYTGTPTNTYQWTFGDGNGSTQQNPIHSYASAGTYNIILNIFDSTGSFCDSARLTLTFSGTPLCNASAGFTHITQGSNTWLYFGASGTYSSHEWKFSDGTTSTQMDPFKSWNNPGWKTVCLLVYDSLGMPCDSNCTSMYINCISNFNYSTNGLTVNFNQVASGSIGSYYWYFGDNTNSSQPSPSHTYSSPGFYNVCLYVNDTLGGFCDSLCKQIQVGGNDVGAGRNDLLKFTTSPNPSNGKFLLTFSEPQEIGIAEIKIVDILGQQQFQKSIHLQHQSIELDLADLSAGTYFLHLRSKNRQGFQKLIILKD